MAKTVAYIRILNNKKDIDAQREGITYYTEQYNIELTKWYVEKVSENSFSKPKWERLKREICERDTVIVLDIDKLGKDWADVKTQYNYLLSNNINLSIIDYNLLNIVVSDINKSIETRLIKGLFIEITCYVIQKEREKISRRTREALEIKKQQGIQLGRKAFLLMKKRFLSSITI